MFKPAQVSIPLRHKTTQLLLDSRTIFSRKQSYLLQCLTNHININIMCIFNLQDIVLKQKVFLIPCQGDSTCAGRLYQFRVKFVGTDLTLIWPN